MLVIYLFAALFGNLILYSDKKSRRDLSWIFASPLIGISAMILPTVMAIPLSLLGFNFQYSLIATWILFFTSLMIHRMRSINSVLILQILMRTLLIFGILVTAHLFLNQMFRPIFTFDSFEMLEISRDIVYGNIDFANTALADWSLSYVGLQIFGVILHLEYVNGVFGVILILTLISIGLSVGLRFRELKDKSCMAFIYLFFASLTTLGFSQIFQTMIYYQNGHSLVLAVYSFLFVNAAHEVDEKRFQIHPYQLILLASLPLLRVEGFVYWLSFFFYYISNVKFEKKILFKFLVTLIPASLYYLVVFFSTTYSTVSKFLFLLVPLLNFFLILVLCLRGRILFIDIILQRIHYVHIALVAYFLIFVFSFDESITSFFAVVTNLLFTGLWGLFWLPTSILFFLLLQSASKELAFSIKNFFIAPLFMILCTGGARGVPFRLTWADSGNRMIFQLCLIIPIIAALHLKSKAKSHV
jgi:hypothetical protein